jgi:hypothetical protein
MQVLKKLAVHAALVATAFAGPVAAQVPTYTFPGVTWAFSTNHAGFSACNTLFLDATGAVGNSDDFSMYGTLFCPSFGGAYANSGNAYFDSAGFFHMTISLGVSHNLVCDNLSGFTLSGSCPIYDNLGTQTGTATITLL